MAGDDKHCYAEYRAALESVHEACDLPYELPDVPCYVQFDVRHMFHTGDRVFLPTVTGGMAHDAHSAETFQVNIDLPLIGSSMTSP
jgi:hypothetical protein